jgi:uncharacterized protein YbjT (DUF2867 family)
MYAITGATGNTGKAIAEALLAKGKKVRVIGRRSERLKPFGDKGAEAFIGSMDDAAAMTRAFTGAKAVYAMIPPNLAAEHVRRYQNSVGEALATAMTHARVQYAVNLSSVGAHLSEKVGPIAGLYDQEQRLNKLKGVNIIHLRPSFFMENLLWSIDLIKKMGINRSSLKPDLPIPMIATKDIAAEAVRLLLNLKFTEKSTRELLGQRDVSMTEATRVIGRAIGRTDLKYVQFPYEDAEKAMIGMGLSPDTARSFIEMYHSFNEGVIRPTEKRSAKNTTPTSLEEFAQHFAMIYKG